MSRIRSIHPGIYTDEAFMELSDAGMIFVMALWTQAWDDGVFEWKPTTLKARVFPSKNHDVGELLLELMRLHFIVSFEVEGKRYGAIRNFRKFQRPKKPNSSGVLPHHLLAYVGMVGEDPGLKPFDIPTRPEPVRNEFGTGPEIGIQMEDGGGRMEDEGDKKIAALSARGNRFEGLLDQLLEASGLHAQRGNGGLEVVGPIIGCLDGGCDLELDVLPTIRAKAKANPRVRSWQWFVEAIWDARNARLAAAEPRAATVSPQNSQAPLPKDWRPSADLVDYGKSLGLSQAEIDWTGESLRNWSSGKTRDDWPGVFRSWLGRKAESLGKQPPSASRMIDPQMDPMKRATEFFRKKAEEKAG